MRKLYPLLALFSSLTAFAEGEHLLPKARLQQRQLLRLQEEDLSERQRSIISAGLSAETLLTLQSNGHEVRSKRCLVKYDAFEKTYSSTLLNETQPLSETSNDNSLFLKRCLSLELPAPLSSTQNLRITLRVWQGRSEQEHAGPEQSVWLDFFLNSRHSGLSEGVETQFRIQD